MQISCQLQNIDRIPAKLKEIIIRAHCPTVQNLLKTTADRTFRLIFRLTVSCLVFLQPRRQQSHAVQFAVRVLGQAVQALKKAWDHIIRKRPFQVVAYLLRLHLFALHIICAKVILPIVILKSLDHGVFHFRHRRHALLNLPGLHTLAVNFYHPVFTVYVKVIPIRQPLGDIPCM